MPWLVDHEQRIKTSIHDFGPTSLLFTVGASASQTPPVNFFAVPTTLRGFGIILQSIKFDLNCVFCFIFIAALNRVSCNVEVQGRT